MCALLDERRRTPHNTYAQYLWVHLDGRPRAAPLITRPRTYKSLLSPPLSLQYYCRRRSTPRSRVTLSTYFVCASHTVSLVNYLLLGKSIFLDLSPVFALRRLAYTYVGRNQIIIIIIIPGTQQTCGNQRVGARRSSPGTDIIIVIIIHHEIARAGYYNIRAHAGGNRRSLCTRNDIHMKYILEWLRVMTCT